MLSAMSQMHLSARAYHRLLKLSRTIADRAGNSQFESQQLAEAYQDLQKLTQY
jgi:magnesium chelatase family protein